jgi:RimJ/RimL family protein N-acetyltransferase
VAALKRPNEGYKQTVFRKAEATEGSDDFDFEAGWIVVDKKFRGKGYSRPLLEAILKLAGESLVYATTREANECMRRTNRRCGLQECGKAYPSEEGDYRLVLYVSRKTELDIKAAV